MEHDVRVAIAPAPAVEHGPVEMHIVKKYGKFHGHMKMADGAEHHMPPMQSMHEAHAAMAPHMMEEPAPDETIGPED